MTAFRILSVAGAAALVAGGSAFAKTGDEDAIAKMLGESFALWTACDIDAAAAYETPDHSGYYPDSVNLQIASDEERAAEKQFCADGGKNEASYALNGVMVFGDAAVAHGAGHYKRTEPDGAVSIDGDFTFTDILVRTKDGWKVRHSHVGAAMPPPAASNAGEAGE